MHPRDWFAVGVRLFGVYVFYRSIAYFLSFLSYRLDLMSRSGLAQELDTSQSHSSYYGVFAAGYFALSYVLVFGAERITRWAFGETPEAANGNDERRGPSDRLLPPTS